MHELSVNFEDKELDKNTDDYDIKYQNKQFEKHFYKGVSLSVIALSILILDIDWIIMGL